MVDSTPSRVVAHVAGIFYLVIIVAGGYGFFSVSDVVVTGDAAETARNLLRAESGWRIGIAALLVMLAADVVVAALLYVLFKPVGPVVSLLAFGFRLVMTAIIGAALVLRYAPLTLLTHTAASTIAPQSEALSYAALVLFERGFAIALVFFGFCCLAIGWLVLRSGLVPRIIGLMMAAAGIAYLVNSFRLIVLPQTSLPFDPVMAAFVAELAFALWLTLAGVSTKRPA